MVGFVKKKDNEISSGIRLSSSGIHVFTRSVPCFNKAKLWTVEEDFFNLILRDAMFDDQLFHYVREPEEVVNIHNRIPDV